MIGLPEHAPDAFLADKGYDADTIRADLAERKIKPVIPGRSNHRVEIEYDRALYKQRNRIERMFGQLKINRAIATRYDQLANSFLGMVHLATARYWLKFVHAAYRIPDCASGAVPILLRASVDLPATKRLTGVPLPWSRLRPCAKDVCRRGGDRSGWLRLPCNGPHEAGQLTGDRCADHRCLLASSAQHSIAGC